jgi:phosphoribosylaminoimidazole-succinocarboxamide synthase
MYRLDSTRLFVTTDRISAFDRVLGLIPFKGQVINQMSAWWFEQTSDIIENHVISVPDPNAMIVREAEVLPIEVVVRGYITGVTSTSLWTLYEQGERQPYGVTLPDGLKKNDRLPTPIITPTTKARDGGHDERLTREEVLNSGLLPPPIWSQIEDVSYALFARGQVVSHWANMIMVDTKYEFGLIDGRLVLIDEIHTPDSSRFWTEQSYNAGGDPEHFDKEYLRLWFARQGYRGEGEPPTLPDDCIAQVASRYIEVYERVIGEEFVPGKQPAAPRITRNIHKVLR